MASAGRYGGALEVLDPLVAPTAPRRTWSWRPWPAPPSPACTASSAGTAWPRGTTNGPWRVPTGAGEAGFDALLGLAADAVGLGDGGTAEARLAEAAALAEGRGQGDWWRQRVRLGWVRPEVALLDERPEAAVAAAHDAVELAEHSGAPRHVAKGLLFLGVGHLEAGRTDEAAAVLRRAGLLAESLGTLPLQWPVRAVLGALLAADHPEDSAQALASALAGR